MLTVTDAAGTRLAHIIDREERLEEVAVRLTHDGQRIAMTVDGERPGDTPFKHKGRTVLLLDERVSQLLESGTLDVKQTDKGDRLTLRRGNATT
jgi:Fe-S cluster assembly iron-binding protein IscA